MEYTLLGVVITYIFIMHIRPYLELTFEYVKHNINYILEWRQLSLEEHKMIMMRKYPEMYKEKCSTSVIGFNHDDAEECYDIEDKN